MRGAGSPSRRAVMFGAALGLVSASEAVAGAGSLFSRGSASGGGGLVPGASRSDPAGSAGSVVQRLPRAGALWEREPPIGAPFRGAAPGRLAIAGPAERRIRMHNAHTGENIDLRYMARGRHDPDAIAEFSRFARDWRENEIKMIDPAALDIVHAVAARIEAPGPLILLSGFRTERTNRSLKGAAPDSLHMRGMALDITHPSRSVATMARAALSLGAGGVGRYDASGFIHVDSGPKRSWSA